ncbi:MAG: hypothetical protein AAF221_14175 [Pseudomonadota bacterium]
MTLKILDKLKGFVNLSVRLALLGAAAGLLAVAPSQAREGSASPSADTSFGAPTQRDASILLAQGQIKDSWKAAQYALTQSGPSADLLVTSAKAALARAKSAPLLSKKRWAKRGRSAYAAALELDPSNEEALLGLATFALRAPDDLGGGHEALARYRERLLEASPPLSIVLAARAAAQDDLELALDHYEIALSQLHGDGYIAEYLSAAHRSDNKPRAYTFITAAPALGPCAQYYAGVLAGHTEQSVDTQLSHYMAFLVNDTQYCNRRDVFEGAVDTALRLAGLLPPARLDAVKQQLAQIQRGKLPKSADESSR